MTLSKTLREYISNKNFAARVFNYGTGKPKQYDMYRLTKADVKELQLMVECEQSPENLTCDGELRGAQLAARVKYLNTVQDELAQLAQLTYA